MFEEQQTLPKALGIVLKLSLLHTKWLLLHFISSYSKNAFEQSCPVILEWDSCFSCSPSASAFVLLEQTVDGWQSWLCFSYARKHFNHKAPVICHYHLKQLYGLSFQDVGTLFGGEQEPSFDVAGVRLASKTAENEMGVCDGRESLPGCCSFWLVIM